MSFTNKVAIVTGAGQGIGFEVCRQLAAGGATVLLNDLDAALANEAADKINRQFAGSTTAVPGDSGDHAFTRELVAKASKVRNRLDIVVANAGITLFGDFFSYSPEAFARVMQVNLAGTFFLAQAACNQMKGQKEGGSLLFTSSVTGHQAHRDLAAYSMSKAAIEMLAKNLVVEISKYRINVNTIAPGATLTARTTAEKDYEKIWAGLTPIGKAASVEDIANAACFLVSSQADHITGQTVVIDGGWTSVSPSPY